MYNLEQHSMVTHLKLEDVEKLLDRFLREAGPTWPDSRAPSEPPEAVMLWNGANSCTGPDEGFKVSVYSINECLTEMLV